MKNRIYQIALKVEIVFIIFLLLCITIVGTCSSRVHKRLQQQVPDSIEIPLDSSPSAVSQNDEQNISLPIIPSEQTLPDSELGSHTAIGLASYYDVFQRHPTASGEQYNPHEFTAAHRSYPFGTLVRVTNLENGKNVVVRINDRGPHKHDRLIDLSGQAARAIDLVETGIARVALEIVE